MSGLSCGHGAFIHFPSSVADVDGVKTGSSFSMGSKNRARRQESEVLITLRKFLETREASRRSTGGSCNSIISSSSYTAKVRAIAVLVLAVTCSSRNGGLRIRRLIDRQTNVVLSTSCRLLSSAEALAKLVVVASLLAMTAPVWCGRMVGGL